MAVIHRVICIAGGPNIRPGGKASGTAGDPGTSVYLGDPVPLFFPPQSSMTAALLTCLGEKNPEDPGSNARGTLHPQTLLVCSLRGRPLWTYSAGVPTHHPTSSWRDSSEHQSSVLPSIQPPASHNPLITSPNQPLGMPSALILPLPWAAAADDHSAVPIAQADTRASALPPSPAFSAPSVTKFYRVYLRNPPPQT